MQLQDALDRFHQYRKVFKTTGVRLTFSLPRQHSLQHYARMIRLFGAPNGLCSSITESKHIKAVKEPWCCRSSLLISCKPQQNNKPSNTTAQWSLC
ncbi:hypothetical protein EDB19DRAFT_1268490 [Suillus lakei]|nr:hypothetical protein EDB19DRAFT_1268490 [Suillus lakei]